MHGDPQVPNFVDPTGWVSIRFKARDDVMIEPMSCAGPLKWKIDRKTAGPCGRSIAHSAHFEHTVLVTEGEPEVLKRTASEGEIGDSIRW